MRLNVEKCRIMHFGKSVYCMTDITGNENVIEESNVERDLGVTVGSDF